MGTVTRDLLPFAVGRNVGELVTLIVLSDFTPSLNDDGSYNFYKGEGSPPFSRFARVVSLTQNEINRLSMGGITVKKGVSVAFPGELVKAPDQVIRADGTLLKVVDYTIEEGATVLLCDEPPLGSDGPSYQSGYVP